MTPEDRIVIAAKDLLDRREARASLRAFYRVVMGPQGLTAPAHLELLMDKLQSITDGTLVHSVTGNPCNNLMVLMPPGSAKSTVISILFPPWFLQRRPGSRILACSYAESLIQSFSRQCRNSIETNQNLLGYGLAPDSRSVEEWATTNGGFYRCAGTTGGISGRRADVGLIDDYIGSQEDADSQNHRDKLWAWYQADFWSRLRGGGQSLQIIVANRRHEDDLVGRILAREESQWEVVKLPFFAKENDVLGRQVGDRLWPDYFTEAMAAKIREMPPRIFGGLYQQEPSPEEGNYFKREWCLTYTRDELAALEKKNPRIYGAGDWAVSEEKDANRSCLGCCAVDEQKNLWILPDIHWKVGGPKETVNAFVQLLKRRQPQVFRSEKGHISKAWGPFLKEQMAAENVWSYIEEVTPSRAKDVRARSIQGLMAMGKVRFPGFEGWWSDALHELLMFPGGKTDDFVDFLAHLGNLVSDMLKTQTVTPYETPDLRPQPITMAWVKKSDEEKRNASLPKYAGR